jgi:sortase (surface protein transpeptidase)
VLRVTPAGLLALSTLMVACGSAPAQPARMTQSAPAVREREPVHRPFAPSSMKPRAVRPPVRMQIPAIDIDAPVEQVGFLDVPRDPANVAWFKTGSAPGEPGTATFDGHLNWIGFAPAVFWNLGKLHEGDEIDVLGGNGERQSWRVDLVTSVPYTSQPPDWLYAGAGPPRISLITCDGSWLGHVYSNRLLVRAVPA